MLGKRNCHFSLMIRNASISNSTRVMTNRFCLYRKTRILGRVLNDSDLLLQFHTEDSDPEDRERMRHALAAELLFTEFHQFESFIAMLVAPFQHLPHWIFLNTYSRGMIKENARQFIAGHFGTLSNGIAQGAEDDVCHVYARNVWKPDDFSNAFVTSSPHSITHLKLTKVDTGILLVIETKAFNSKESRAYVQIMSTY
jgi:hypothetical protein